MTDCNLFTGRISAEHFPALFGPDGKQPLDRDAARARLEAIAHDANAALGKALSPNEIAEGFLRIAVDNMANAIRKISIARGHDVTRYTLACFGGAGGQHACQVADALGMERILIHPLAGVLSAYGIGLAEVKAIREMSWLKPLDEDFSDGLGRLEESARQALIEQGIDPASIRDRTARAAAHAGQRQCHRIGDRLARSDARAVRRAPPQALRLCRGRHRADRRFARGDRDIRERAKRELRRGGGHWCRADRGGPVERLSPRRNRS